VNNWISGIDEAGKGPVLGNLVIALASIDAEAEPELTELGITDSKKLTREKREEFFPQIKKLCKYSIVEITASQLNERMGRESLNLIEAKAMGGLAASFPGRIYIDLPEKNASKFIEKANLGKREVVAEHKADLKYPIVGAASILAKVTRDRRIEELKEKVGEEIGSGYTSDERTINAIKNPKIRAKLKGEIRTRWSTVERVMQPKLTEF